MKQSLEYYKLFLWSEEKRYLPVIFLTHGTGSLIWTLDDSAPSCLFGNSQQGLLFPMRHSCTISRREYMERCYYWLTVSFNPPEIIGEIWRPCSKLSDLNRIQFLHHRRKHHSIHPCPRGRAGPARSQYASCNRRLKPLLASAVEIISTPVQSVQLVM